MNREKFEKAKSRFSEFLGAQGELRLFIAEDIEKEVLDEICEFIDFKLADAAREMVAAVDEDKTEEAISWINGWYKGMAPISDLKAFEVSVPTPIFKEGNKND